MTLSEFKVVGHATIGLYLKVIRLGVLRSTWIRHNAVPIMSDEMYDPVALCPQMPTSTNPLQFNKPLWRSLEDKFAVVPGNDIQICGQVMHMYFRSFPDTITLV